MANCSAVQQNQKTADRWEEEESTPSTMPPESSDEGDQSTRSSNSDESECSPPRQLQAGLYDDPSPSTTIPSQSHADPSLPTKSSSSQPSEARPTPPTFGGKAQDKFSVDETFFIFDWDDTILPSSWVQRQGLRLDANSHPTAEQRSILAEVASVVGQTLRAARQHGTVILVTNAERGWIELSCQKFLPTLAPMLENVKLVSARTTYESTQGHSPLDWKLCAFDVEIKRFFGAETVFDPTMRKNIFSLGDSIHEREALLRATLSAPNCHSKSLKFVERPDTSQICKQHELIVNAFGQLVHHQGNLDLCLRCP